ncbi:MAG: hypothetical protein K0Q73_6352 [Paenibacillus sp.]|jgi:predicted glycosyltransferase involved in capsule biosynthesis|nr:hypothetical protein [Paenibacillus sp.]
MFNHVSILMAYQKDNGHRDKIFNWIKKYYKVAMPGIELCVGESTEISFSRSQGMNLAAKMATRDIFVIADGDILYDPSIILDSIQLLKKYAWVIPFHHQKIINLSKSNTEMVLGSKPKWPLQVKISDYEVEKRDVNFAGKINILTRKSFEEVRGFDERFIGYGWEDNAFHDAVSTICGPFKRLDRKLYHLWHPPVVAKGNPYWEKNKVLGLRYREAKGDKTSLLKIIQEREVNKNGSK